MPPTSIQTYTLLQNKIWVALDLDDTLYSFRAASAAAAAAAIFSDYQSILKQTTASASSDGRTSTSYRRERFEALLCGQGITPADDKVNWLLSVYKEGPRVALTVGPGAGELLRYLKEVEKTVLVAMEGPRDAQE
ncbi:hypothetical protein BJY04DRAFT_221348 [Aspergillus karnatakaensis]|uniref:uncharacterized protein n=1 Tax=Aspergillus karnatakaensis TaxID=1810916 RepID=UPI003CCDB243